MIAREYVPPQGLLNNSGKTLRLIFSPSNVQHDIILVRAFRVPLLQRIQEIRTDSDLSCRETAHQTQSTTNKLHIINQQNVRELRSMVGAIKRTMNHHFRPRNESFGKSSSRCTQKDTLYAEGASMNKIDRVLRTMSSRNENKLFE